MKNKALFLDRDGVINFDKTHHIHKIEDFELIPGVVEALKKAQEKSYKLIIITNQAGIGRGYYTEEDYFKFRDFLHNELKKQGITIDAEYYCPHHPEKGIGEYKKDCECRKPKTGMIEKAIQENNIDATQSYCIGDKWSDLKMGVKFGCKLILVKTGESGRDVENKVEAEVANDLLEAVDKFVE